MHADQTEFEGSLEDISSEVNSLGGYTDVEKVHARRQGTSSTQHRVLAYLYGVSWLVCGEDVHCSRWSDIF